MQTRIVRTAAVLAALAVSAGAAAFRTEDMPAAMLVPIGSAGVIDARARFERITCRINEERGRRFPDFRECSEIFSPMGVVAPSPGVERREPCCYTLVFVPGFLGECLAHLGTPFSDSHERLRRSGHDVHVIPVKGRASSRVNGRQIADYLALHDARLGTVVMVGYSKGVPDILEALAASPGAGWLKKIRAVVSVAGVVSGTPVADGLDGLYDTLLARLPWKACAPEDGGGVESLTRNARLQFLAGNPPPHGVRFYTLAALPRSSGVNPLLGAFHAALGAQGPNDGQVMAQDAVVPGSTLLGYLNADHWAVALPFNRSNSIESAVLRIANAFPREVVIDAVLEFLAGAQD